MGNNLTEYLRHGRGCKILVYPYSGSMDPWPVTKVLREKYPEAYGNCRCTCGLEQLCTELGITAE